MKHVESLQTSDAVHPAEWLCSYLRSWARHDVYFGVMGGWLTAVRQSFCVPTACVEISSRSVSPRGFSLPEHFVLTGVVVVDSLVYRHPHGHEDAGKRGRINPRFLDPETMIEEIRRIDALNRRFDLLVLPLSRIYRSEGVTVDALLTLLDNFLAALKDGRQYALEIQNDEYLLPSYFQCLQHHGIAHVLRGEELLDRILQPHVLTTGHVVVRMTACGDQMLLMGLRETVRRCTEERKKLFVYVEDGVEMSALSFLMMMMNVLDKDLAKLSPIRRNAA